MLPYALKITWFLFSLIGSLCCWLTLWAFGRVVQAKWAPLLYCIGTTLMQGVLCLGMAYHMDTFSMPNSFCILQTIFVAAGSFITTGVVLALSLATSMTVQKPKTWGDASRALQWQKIFAFPVVGTTVFGTTAYIAFSLAFHSVKPTDDMWCDSSSPEWVRLIGSSGIPFLLSIPLLYQSTQSYIRIRTTNSHLLRSRPETSNALPCATSHKSRRTARVSLKDAAMLPVNLALTISRKSSIVSVSSLKGERSEKRVPVPATVISGRETLQRRGQSFSFRPKSPAISPLPLVFLRSAETGSRPAASMNLSRTSFGIGVSGLRLEGRNSSRFSFPQGMLHLDDTSSPVSSVFPTFANDDDPPAVGSNVNVGGGISGVNNRRPDSEIRQDIIRVSLVDEDEDDCDIRQTNYPEEDVDDMRGIDLVTSESGSVVEEKIEFGSVIDIEAARDGATDFVLDYSRTGSESSVKRTPTSMSLSANGIYKKPRREPAWLPPVIWRVIIFQFTFVFIQFLAFVTTFADLVVSNRTSPSPFGTQHIALLLTAWCPVLIFGSLRLVRRNLLPWRPLCLS